MTDTFDFVVVGAGSGGCAVAGRLSEDPATSVALLDAGGPNDNWVVTTPGALVLMVAGGVNNWRFHTVPQKGLNGRIGYQPRGKGLGGSSAINAMVYIRGHRWDYDHWAALGNNGWSYADVLPYFKRSEDNSDFDGEYHAKGGPLRVNRLRTDNPVQEMFLDAAREAQFRIREDFNADDQEGLGIYQVTQHNGERWSAARAYVHPHMATRSNLRVETSAHATRLLFEGRRAVGVEYRRGNELRQIRARREVILAAGAFQSPHLLMLSGVGDAATLGKHGIATVHHLPGVGQNLQDHPDFIFTYLSDAPYFTGITFSGIAHQIRAIGQYRRERRGPMTTNFAECGGFLKARGARILQPAKPDDPNWKARRKFPPTLVVGASEQMTVMQEEIFGPILPIMGYREAREPIAHINKHDRPLALYWFGRNTAARDEVLARTVSGGVTVNDCLFHFAQINQPMGGVGPSGTGAYHGEWGFKTFSKLKPVFYRSALNRLADLYPPYGGKIARLEKLMRFMS